MATAPGPLRTAGFGVRALAYLVDAVLLALVGGAFPFLVISSSSAKASGTGSAVVSLVYFAIFWSALGDGRTLGMRVFGLQVRRVDGQLLGVGGAIVRWIGLWISFVVCFLGVIWVAFDAHHQGWHDKIAGTLVVEVRG